MSTMDSFESAGDADELKDFAEVPISCQLPNENVNSTKSAQSSQVRTRSIRNKREWSEIQSFDGLKAAEGYIKQQNQWDLKVTNESKSGQILKYYYCKKSRSSKCKAALYLLINSDNFNVSLFQCKTLHTHLEEKITAQQKDKVSELYKLGITKPKIINQHLRDSGLGEVESQRLYNYRASMKNIICAPVTKYSHFQKWIDDYKEKTPPLQEMNMDFPFILAYDVAANPTPYLRFVISTKRLLLNGSLTRHIHADSAYKLVWNDFPIQIVGTSDKNKHFHPIAIAMCSTQTAEDFEFVFQNVKLGIESLSGPFRPSTLVADACRAITNGFSKVFGNPVRVYCWDHVARNLKNELSSIKDKRMREDVRRDIYYIQLSENEKIFTSACNLWITKWNMGEGKEFVDYFTKQWIEDCSGWYTGKSKGVPCTNNALKCENNFIKSYLLRTKLPLNKFLPQMLAIGKNWSLDRDPQLPNTKTFFTEPSLTDDLQQRAFNWQLHADVMSNGDHTIHYISAKDGPKLTRELISKYKSSRQNGTWLTFDDFKTTEFQIWKVMTPSTNWCDSTCTCSSFQKDYICKHVIGIACRMENLEIPAALRLDIPIGRKKQRGRPKKMESALQTDN